MQSAGGYIRVIFLFIILILGNECLAHRLIPPFSSFSEIPHQLTVATADNVDDLSKSGKWKNYSDKIKDARRIVKKVKDAANFLNTLTGNEDLVSLPVGIRVGSPDGSFTATMVIEDIRIFQNYTQLFVILEIEAPILGDQPMIFYSSDLKFSAQAGIIGDATLALMTDFPINVVDKKAMLLLKGGLPRLGDLQDSRTYAMIGCNGFESLNIAGEGQADLGKQEMNYVVKATVNDKLADTAGEAMTKLKGRTIPVRISGPFEKLKYNIALEDAVKEEVKEKVKEKVEEKVKEKLNDKVGDKLKDKLKGLF